MKKKPLTATMVAALDDAMQHGGLERFVGGYWSWAMAHRDHNGIPHPHHGTSTVQALVTRGKMEYTEWRDGRNGRFPIRCAVITFTGERHDDI